MTHPLLLLGVGGVLGTWARYGVNCWFLQWEWAKEFPWATLVVNVSGSFVLALAAVLVLERLPAQHHPWFVLVGTGFCGAYTTFSTFEWETYLLVRRGDFGLAFSNIGVSFLAGFLGVMLGVAAARSWGPA